MLSSFLLTDLNALWERTFFHPFLNDKQLPDRLYCSCQVKRYRYIFLKINNLPPQLLNLTTGKRGLLRVDCLLHLEKILNFLGLLCWLFTMPFPLYFGQTVLCPVCTSSMQQKDCFSVLISLLTLVLRFKPFLSCGPHASHFSLCTDYLIEQLPS